MIKNPHLVEIGKNVSIASFVHIWGGGGVKIGNNVLIGSHSCIITETHDYLATDMYHSHIKKPIVIEDNVWIGAHVMVLPGITVQSGSVIGAGSVLTKDTEGNSIYIGSPAKKIKSRI